MEEINVSGIQVYYYYVCPRKLWYYTNGLSMESDNENVLLGKKIDDLTYSKRKKHILIDNTINIDFIAEHNILHEVKKSRAIEEASIAQLKYYLFYLKERGVDNLKGRIDYPLLKQSVNVELSSEDEQEMKYVVQEIKRIVSCALPPKYNKQKICKKCAYYDLCCI